jgi:hypothetical protein
MVMQKILSYLLDHPDAKDTIQGILQWWLPHGGMVWRQEEIQEALDVLVARGWLTQRHTPSCQMLYGRRSGGSYATLMTKQDALVRDRV